jgi:transcriptional regulator of heat shock response
LPVVAGLEPQVAVQVTDDAPRLFAEGYVKGLQNRVMDLVARRELYTARFRRHIKQKEFDQAKTLLETFRGLEDRSDLGRQLDQQVQRVKSSDRRVQAKIDQLFTDTRQLLLKFLDPRTSNQLADELLRAQRPG